MIRPVIAVAAATAFTLAVSACGDDAEDTAAPSTTMALPTTSAHGVSTTAPVTTSPPPVYPTVPPAPAGQIDCGPGYNGLQVIAVTTAGTAFCGTALAVSGAYGVRVEDGPATVTVSGTNWRCQELQGDPNPYFECLNESNPAEKVQIFS